LIAQCVSLSLFFLACTQMIIYQTGQLSLSSICLTKTGYTTSPSVAHGRMQFTVKRALTQSPLINVKIMTEFHRKGQREADHFTTTNCKPQTIRSNRLPYAILTITQRDTHRHIHTKKYESHPIPSPPPLHKNYVAFSVPNCTK